MFPKSNIDFFMRKFTGETWKNCGRKVTINKSLDAKKVVGVVFPNRPHIDSKTP